MKDQTERFSVSYFFFLFIPPLLDIMGGTLEFRFATLYCICYSPWGAMADEAGSHVISHRQGSLSLLLQSAAFRKPFCTKQKGKPFARLWCCSMWQDAKSHQHM